MADSGSFTVWAVMTVFDLNQPSWIRIIFPADARYVMLAGNPAITYSASKVVGLLHLYAEGGKSWTN